VSRDLPVDFVTLSSASLVGSQDIPDLAQIYLENRVIVAAEALEHIRRNEKDIARIFAGRDIQYILQAGFNESLIQRSVGHLQEIYLFVEQSFSSNSPIFEQLGRIFSPFPGVVWMPARCQLTPIFNGDTECDRDSVLLSRTQRFHKSAQLLPEDVSKPDASPLDQDEGTGSRNSGNVDRSNTEGRDLDDGDSSLVGRQGPSQSPSSCTKTPSVETQLSSVRNDEPSPPPSEGFIPQAYFDVIARIKTTESQESHTLQITGALTSSMVCI
jgi:hypothetical protein